ncbi:hypothetical protein M2459_002697 [Parabacteroides sp. PF5-5]|uniref:DUF2851 family protein n=1 Tax=unclassified Parabacteroides TaxID=2649774 RepID=UPI002475851D|nr:MULTISPECIES: DUF2851 family protein [unclassified Parabacteroides]MDH6316875.1 hypothetical protein [Parabacteroides sp. PF5-13]MDH6328060.1 hypothetical protein [Parabacteroides sp. PH5-41]MDH6335932.1 hypothetical protein [Parabacteroides sp. PF5-5]MDH6346926.1 hypothetical protein [Parabacteroides sp. PH5-46]MDH6361888.1 hypothetical protein [Parabacteroides sp. PH5-16]
MERLLHYVWKYKLYSPTGLVTTDGLPVSVIDPGIQNTDAGPDFFNAKVKIGETLWAGSVEIHDKASDWLRHNHDKDKAYDAVVLHLVGVNDAGICRTNNEPIPQACLPVPEHVRKNIDWLLRQDLAIPCFHTIREIPPIQLSSWMEALLSERLERKTKDIFLLLDQYGNDWNEVFYILLSRCFGFGINNDAFERLARSLPFRYIQKQRNSSSQVESLLFGQAGMLDEEGNCHYYRLLQQEYKFLKHKFSLAPLDQSVFKSLRVRPASFPHVKLAQLAAIWYRYDTLFSLILEEKDIEQTKKLLQVLPSDYWETHYHFKYASPQKEKRLGFNALNILLINAVVPILFAYGQKNKQDEYCERAISLLERIPPEGNNIISTFSKAGIHVSHAGDTQALIQLKREYCEKKKCLYCRIGFRLLKRV